jgi:hypothetical protein
MIVIKNSNYFVLSFFITASLSLLFLACPAAAEEASINEVDDSKIFIFGYGAGSVRVSDAKFRKSISGKPELIQPNQWGVGKSLYFCYLIGNFSKKHEARTVKYIVDRYIESYKFQEKIGATELSCDKSVDIFVIDGLHVNFLKSGRRLGQSYMDDNIKNAQRFGSSLPYYGIIGAYDRLVLEKISNILQKSEHEYQETNNNSRSELEQLAIGNSREKIYFVKFGNQKDEKRICKLLRFNEDDAPIYGLANTLGGVYDKNNRFQVRQKISAEFRDLDSFWKSVNLNDGDSYGNRGRGFSPCNIFIDYAYNTSVILKALESNGSKFSFGGFNSLEMSAKYNKFDNVKDYRLAVEIGASYSEYDRLKGYGVFDRDGFLVAVREMNQLGYFDGQHIRDVLSFLEDKLEGKGLGRSALWVRNQRQKLEAAEARSAELEYNKCLNKGGYYRTKNITAKRTIERNCS